LVLAFDKKRLKVLKFPTIVDFRMVIAFMPKDILKFLIKLDPESPLSVLKSIIMLFVKNKIRIILARTLFNLNTPEAYEKAKKYFA